MGFSSVPSFSMVMVTLSPGLRSRGRLAMDAHTGRRAGGDHAAGLPRMIWLSPDDALTLGAGPCYL